MTLKALLPATIVATAAVLGATLVAAVTGTTGPAVSLFESGHARPRRPKRRPRAFARARPA